MVAVAALFSQADAAGPRAPARKGMRPRIVRPNRDLPPPPLRLADLGSAPETPPAEAAPATEKPAPAPEPVAEKKEEVKPETKAETKADADVSVSCRAEAASRELKVSCSDGKTWTMKSAGLILPPVLRCSTQHPECCQIGFSKMRDVQLADLVRVGEGQSPLCHMRVRDFLTNPPSQALAAARNRLDDELPPGLRGEATSAKVKCPKGQYPALGGCHDARKLLQALRPPPVSDPNRPLVPEAEEVVARMRHEFDVSGKCPQAALDIDVLKRIYNAAQLRAELVTDAPLDVTPLLARARFPGRVQPEPHLPASCGYNTDNKKWYQTTLHCVSSDICYAQSNDTLEHTCVRFHRATTATGTSPYFWPMANCTNVPSCSAMMGSKCTGVARLTALGSGIYLMIQEDPAGLPYYYGVLFARARSRSAQEIAEAKRARGLLYDMAKNLPNEGERAQLRSLIDAQPE